MYTETTPKSSDNWSAWEASKKIFTEGVHSITARCTDKAGNVNQERICITVTITPSPVATNLLLVERYRLSSYLGAHGPVEFLKLSRFCQARRRNLQTRVSNSKDGTLSKYF